MNPSLKPACPRCGTATTRASTEEARHVASTKYLVGVAAHRCKRCRDTFIDGKLLERVELTIAADLALAGPCSGETLRFMRKALGYPAAKLASLLDVAPETVSRWETDQRSVDLNAWLTVGSIVLEHAGRSSTTLARITAAKKPMRRPKIVKLALAGKLASS